MVIPPSVIESDDEEESADNPSVSTASDVSDRDMALDHEKNDHSLGITSLLEVAGQVFGLLLSSTLLLGKVLVGILSCTALRTFRRVFSHVLPEVYPQMVGWYGCSKQIWSVSSCRVSTLTSFVSSFHSLISFFHLSFSFHSVGLVIAHWILSDYVTLPATMLFMWYLFRKYYWWTLFMALLW